MTATVNTEELEAKVKDMYRHVAQQPHDRFHFELGAPVALRAGYDADRLAAVPERAVESFAGVGYFFDLAPLQAGETVVDLGSGSGMDAFYASGLVGPTGHVYGIDFTKEQLDKARRLADEAGLVLWANQPSPKRGPEQNERAVARRRLPFRLESTGEWGSGARWLRRTRGAGGKAEGCGPGWGQWPGGDGP